MASVGSVERGPIKALSTTAALVGSGGEDLAAGIEVDGLGGLVLVRFCRGSGRDRWIASGDTVADIVG